jgi:hypothetical protein
LHWARAQSHAGVYCGARQIYGDKRWPEAIRNAVISRKAYCLYGFLTCGSLLLEGASTFGATRGPPC